MKYFFLIPFTIFAWVFVQIDKQEILAPTPLAIAGHDNPVELGKVHWLRDLTEAKAQAKANDKPIFLLFQEVPGCSTCRHYGSEVLSHPLVVEAIESLFIPLAIHNNKSGADAKVLKAFGEPSWNNPVVRIIRNNQENIVPRLSGNYTLAGLVTNMVLSLQINGTEIPPYLQLLHEELTARQNGLEEANLSMYCFWSGEKNLGHLDGVVETQAGFMNGREVVKVKYDPEAISLSDLVEHGAKTGCADRVFVDDQKQKAQAAQVLGNNKIDQTGKFRLDADPKYYLGHTPYQYVPMTQLQAARVNSLLANRQSPEAVLSPQQRSLAKYIAAHPQAGWKSRVNETDLIGAWGEVEAMVAKGG